jgi:hypothetical protein
MNGWNKCDTYRQQNTIKTYTKVNPNICKHISEPGGHYVKWNKADTEKQMPHDLTDKYNLKKSLS